MTRRTPLAASLLLLASTAPSYAAFFLPINTTLIIPTGDAFFSAAGVDSAGNTIGTDCILASPCQTPQKALAFQAANIASNPAQSLKFYFIDRGGMFFVSSTLVYNSHHTVSPGFTVSWLAYPGQHPIFSGGRDIHGTWTAATPIPNGSGINGCVSNALAGSAPLVDGTTTTNAGLYVGAAWFNGLWTAEVIQPRIGSPADVVPGTAGTIPTEASIAQGPTASFTSGSTSVGISDMSKIGIVGQTLMFDTAQDGFTSFFDYFILSKSAATGAGTITLSSTGPTGSAVSATGTGAGIQVSDATQTVNHGGRTATSGINQFPVNAGYNTATNQADVKVWMSVSNGASPSLIPVAAATSSQVTLASRWSLYRTLYSGTRIRRWNVFEDLGTLGKTGELYTNRTTGAIYYTPRAGETCSSINAPGYVIIPTNPEILLKISSATFDGSVNAAPVGNFIINGIAFEHANNSTLTGVHNLNGFVGGYIGGGGQSSYSMGDAAVTMVGATNVDLENVVIQHVASSGLNVAWGSNHVTVNNLVMGDVGGHGILTGMGNMTGNNYQYETDAGYYGTFALGPSTPSLNTSGAPHNVDLTGNSDCCNTFTNISMLDVGKVNNGGACMAVAGWQSDVVDHNRFLRCPGAGFQEDGDGLLTVGAPSYSGNGAAYGGVMLTQVYNNDWSYNEIGYIGAETDLSGGIIPGSPGFSDFGGFYIRGPQDGLADGSSPKGLGLTVSHNIVHDTSNGCIQNVQSGGTIQPHGLNAVLEYFDGDNTHGVNSHDNLFYNSALVNGIAPCPGNITQHTGGFRNTFKNNIYAGTYPAGYTMPGDYGPRGDIGPYPMQPFRSMAYTCATSNVCYTINLGRLYSATTSGTSGSTAATVPTCTSGACSVDGTMTWTFVENLPGNSFQTEVSNITGWAVAGGGGSNADFPQGAQWFAINPQFTKTDDSIYWESGSVMTFYNNQGSHTLFSAWVALGQDVTTNTLGGFNCNPNFIDMSGASGYAGFQPNPSGCPGLGYVWPDFSTVGPQNGPPPPPVPVPSFYVAPSPLGSDSNSGLTRSAPFLTLTKAQTAMRASGIVLTTTLLAGTTAITSPIQLTAADAGETWQGDIANSAAYNAAIVDASSTAEEAFCVRGAPNVTFNGFKIQNPTYIGVMVHGGVNFGPNTCGNGGTIAAASSVTIKNMEIANVLTPSVSRYADSGCVVGQGIVTGMKVDHIYCHNSGGMGVRISANSSAGCSPCDDISHSSITNNYAQFTMQGGSNVTNDGGPIYIEDYQATSTDLLISNNRALDFEGGTGSGSFNGPIQGIYEDASVSNATITGNDIGPPGVGGWTFKNFWVNNCGKNNVVTNNIVDLGTVNNMSIINYGTCSSPAVITAMTGNQFKSNVIVANFTASTLATGGYGGQTGQSFLEGGTLPAFPALAANMYFNYGGGAIYVPDGTDIADSTRQLVNPQCSTTTGHDHVLAGTSPAYSAPVNFVPIVGGWGPPGFIPPATGATVSCP